ncbi:lysophospholipid acyltransferase family protein [Bacteroides caecigallinarum]|uniref:lysophospholipid acyltransferase family protein n=1 Tax=Bacteroides caecigallinarum TaxID=1411144 RepID=UPI001F166255|nr:lysophospholipid acyltransferase family protein [Bacteroides caecigallinarum]MCF2593362.1 lysophospholipid acyltransferase family protein [Bacteroides caecigallinarum]
MTYHLLSFFMKLLAVLPFSVLYFLSDCIFYLIYYLVRYRRAIVRKNLTESFPEKSEQEIIYIEKKFYRFFTDNIFESFKMATISPKGISRRIKFTNVDVVNSILSEGKSISLYLGHYGNWEWVSSMPLHLKEGVVAAQIYHKLHNDDMNRLILNNRGRMGAVSIEMYKTARYINELASQNKVSIIGFIADQSPRKKDSRYFIPFLNHNVPVLTGTEKITKHYGFEAFFIRMKRVKRGFYEVEFVKMHDNPKSLPDFELTSIYFSLLENMIKTAPELYLWTHNRFKHAI